MDELVEHLADKVGLDKAVAGRTIGIILGFLRTEGPTEKVQTLIDRIPGAEALIDSAGGKGGISRLMGGGVMGLGVKLMGLGLGMAEIKSVARELFKYGQDQLGADEMGEIIAATPGLSQFS